jgi:hypothetical protein
MSNREKVQVVGLFAGDLHLSERCPVSRAEKKNWFEAQGHNLSQLKKMQEEYDCPVFLAGDVFDKWDSSACLINWTIQRLPEKCYGIPGNHDLPNHNYLEIDRCAYYTLVEANKVKNLIPAGGMATGIDSLSVTPFPCDFEITPVNEPHSLALNIALVHSFIWTEKTGYEGADPQCRYGKILPDLKGYDAAFFSDNHQSFLIVKEGKPTVCNMGAFVCRKITEKNHKPFVAALLSNGKVEKKYLDVSKDEWSDTGKELEDVGSSLSVDLTEFVDEMVDARAHGEDWRQLVKRWCGKQKLKKEIESIILKAVEGEK